MHLVFTLEHVILKPEDKLLWAHCQPLFNVIEFMQWLKTSNHHITIWCERELTAENKYVTEQWLALEQIPYDRLLFDKPYNPVMVTETPPNTKYYKHVGDLNIVADMFEEWKEWIRKQEE